MLGVGLALAVAALATQTSGASAAPEAPKDDKAEFAKLKKRSDALAKEYRGELVSLDEAKKAAQKAGTGADRATREYEVARSAVGRLAASSYMSGQLDTVPMVTAADSERAVHDAAVVEHLARNNGRKIENLRALTDQANRAREDAKAKLAEVRKEIDDLEGQRDRVRKLLAKYKPEKPVQSGKPDGASGTKSPIMGNTMTPRMRTAMQEIDAKFGPFPAIGCARPGDPQDHGSGTACDFMENAAGRMPSASAQAHGDQVAQYVISNASRLGIKYVIWKQRIYDMRSGSGWKAMEDRGGITQNHFDHVHVSVL
ncbi:hypothetical protein EBO15_14795 [Actinomadura harenae]|uniref:ARB-07466-like C-terminal domain-containing protein n=1 Tax=Actinomadura harenae TaxID=2483351 RepID=A0A3M2M2Z8_9ACTN|nr:hypothetical protein EBO15_14795 [Actinomadura harenae]